jgi:hypothetical protein
MTASTIFVIGLPSALAGCATNLPRNLADHENRVDQAEVSGGGQAGVRRLPLAARPRASTRPD